LYAAPNRLTVEIDYVKESGEQTTLEIEAYSLRRTKAANIVLFAYDSQKPDHIRNYPTDRIRGARATARTFAPRYLIELTPGGMQPILPTARTGRRF
jgi:predicted DNA-binding transcriptional regulator YafY